MLSSWKSGKASNTLHEYLADTLAAAGANAQVESAAFTDVDATNPVRLNNTSQIFIDWVKVSGSEMAVDHAGMADPMKYHLAKGLKEQSKDIEAAILAGSRASGNSGVARQLVGAILAISTKLAYWCNKVYTALHETTFMQTVPKALYS